MKYIKRIVIALVFVAICVTISYHLSYPIKLNGITLANHISEYYNRGRSVGNEDTIVLRGSGVEIGKNEYYLVDVGEKFGSVTLEKGLTGRYKITHLSYGAGNFLDGIVESDGKKYLLFAGRDITSQIKKVTVLIDGQTYEMDIPNANECFLLYTEIDNHAEDNHVNRDNIVFYNDKGEDITKLYNLSGGGIP